MAKINNQPLNLLMLFCGLWLILFAYSSQAQQLDIDFYENDHVTNQLPIFENRFHLDAQLDEITLLFYRVSGTPPVILVRPDGTKLKVDYAKRDGIQWYDDRTFDMIKLKNPMPGPWQAIGSILPESKIMVISQVRLEVSPLPEILLTGEVIKVTGKIYNGEQAINDPEFRDVIELNVEFFSSNDSAYDNFGAEPIELTTFRDDGYELDEYAGDGIFTGEFELDFAPGQWLPVYHIKLPMAERKLELAPVILRESPVTLSVTTSENVETAHELRFNIDKSFVDVDSIILQGKVSYPDRHSEPYSIVNGSGDFRLKEIPFTEGGIHRVKTSVFGKTLKGREFRLVLPEFSFNVSHQAFAGLPEGNNTGEPSLELTEEAYLKQQEKRSKERLAQQEEAMAEQLAQQQAQLAQKQMQTYILIAVGNLVVLAIAFVAYVMLTRKKLKHKKKK